jgi:hypothetical protein
VSVVRAVDDVIDGDLDRDIVTAFDVLSVSMSADDRSADD